MPRNANYLDRFGPLHPAPRPELPPLSDYLEQILEPIGDDVLTLARAAGAGPLAADMRAAIDTHFDLALGGSRV